MSDVDQLISELFPKAEGGEGQAHRELPASQADWDDSEGENDNVASVDRVTSEPKVSRSLEPSKIEGRVTEKITRQNYYDDSDETDTETGTGPSRSVKFTVPFPSLPSGIGMACNGRCYVTNIGAKGLAHPSVEQLLLVDEGKYNELSSQQQLLDRKGAFHTSNPNAGNGAVDKLADETGFRGGCPFLQCRKCNYVVIRLQGASWQDGDGKLDLYLTVRNFYPDWSRLASSYPVGIPKSSDRKKVLQPSSDCAAYCCQCSWLTVKSEQEKVETHLTDLTKFVGREVSRCFATQLPLPPEENRRPPLWVCVGHAPSF
ncbi:putative Retinal Maintenance [Trypanosoma vivax]|uniref:Cilia- and flagella-associated protein 418 n=1 Tax=Trypanosoma vivax (strain Y486) TaxID=1055687 RepID=G0TU39_TRYVY|nr:hypothetical protein TRVL_00157 [Trypanosoma vivax]KAH8614134.1 putative Retinal Maintenance [Trypanosoma vivax]CCC47473.1 conserved hypothetical protein [Trypanosoma vivax Y486]